GTPQTDATGPASSGAEPRATKPPLWTTASMSWGGTTTSPIQVSFGRETVAAHAAISRATSIRNAGMNNEYRLASGRAGGEHRLPETRLDVRGSRPEIPRGHRDRRG